MKNNKTFQLGDLNFELSFKAGCSIFWRFIRKITIRIIQNLFLEIKEHIPILKLFFNLFEK